METGPEFDEFVRARSAALLRTAYALAGDYGHAEDLLQVTLLRTARHWRQAREAPEAYARRVLVNLCRDRWRWLRRRPPETLCAEHPAAPSPGPVDATSDQTVAHASMVQALAGLSTGQRQVIVLRFLEDLSVSQTAELLGISTGTVKSYTARALLALRTMVDDGAAANAAATEVPNAH